MSALVRITTGIMPQHSRVGMSRAMAQFGEVVHCHKPPYSGIPGEDFVNVRFGTQEAADRAYAALKAGQVFVDGFPVGVGPAGGKGGNDGPLAISNSGGGGPPRRPRSRSPPRLYGRNRARSPMGRGRSPDGGGSRRFAQRSPPRERRKRSPPGEAPRANFPSRNDPKSPSPRRLVREMGGRRSRSRSYARDRRWDERASEFSGGEEPLLPSRSQSIDGGRILRDDRNVQVDLVEAAGYAKRPNWRKRYRRVLPFDEARRCVQAIGFGCRNEWDDWVADGKKSPFLGPYVPNDPEAMYAEEWEGWDDFLGIILDFKEARLVSRMLGLQSQEDWYSFVEADAVRLRSLRLPALPSVYYAAEWQGYEDWLALPNETLFVPKEWNERGDDGDDG
ncbi:unnamed protein product [Cladocopium goreaui]|uniref:NAD(+) synthase (Glutamine-hydrolyzing) (NAD(+ ) synthase [glutamine-hydrolyzing]) n=1 Tax=Cladocopium goreaui TaxID=2562237 RepID=A0A9P1DHK2_9DINO|nr:unnamed protein product [Cladocopium goreaui]